MGEKRRAKSKNKAAKVTRHGLRPHELRQQQDAFKTSATQAPPPPVTDRKIPKM